MTLEQFCAAMGVLTPKSLPQGRWVRCGTKDHPNSKSGAVKLMGKFAFVRNWEVADGTGTWFAEGESIEAKKDVREMVRKADAEVRRNAQKAAQRAEQILSECELATHPYLASKGFPDELVNVLNREAENIMVVPMRRAAQVVGAQQISPDGAKKFLYGQRSGGAEFVIGQRGTHILCEGYATALSAQQALRNLKAQHILHVTFSAGNMKKVAGGLSAGLVIADNDASGTGERIAREIGWPYWISDKVNEDANDYAQRRGIFALAMGIRQVLSGRMRA